ncbi:unnamed protein product [Dibothriocephalus latus]|uniref:Uncharacterized protein n=1 Tax=Dibothriocephalus latus TaxID=60516 RepID=A0A3P7MTD8_DIBLA|nr:unnamed protein product [Dibothriocephalus latus]
MVCLSPEYLALAAPIPTTYRWLRRLSFLQKLCMSVIIGNYIIHGAGMAACIYVDSYFRVVLHLSNVSEPTTDLPSHVVRPPQHAISVEIGNGLWVFHENRLVAAGAETIEDPTDAHFAAARSLWGLCRIRSIRPAPIIMGIMLSLGIGLVILFTSLLCALFDRRSFITGGLAGSFSGLIANILIEHWEADMFACMKSITVGMDGKTRFVFGRIFHYTPAGPGPCVAILAFCNACFVSQVIASFYMLFKNPKRL